MRPVFGQDHLKVGYVAQNAGDYIVYVMGNSTSQGTQSLHALKVETLLAIRAHSTGNQTQDEEILLNKGVVKFDRYHLTRAETESSYTGVPSLFKIRQKKARPKVTEGKRGGACADKREKRAIRINLS